MQNLLKPEQKSELKKVVESYIVKGKMAPQLKNQKAPLKSMTGEALTITEKDGKLTVNGANVVKTEITAKNGVIHLIDQVLEEKGLSRTGPEAGSCSSEQPKPETPKP